MANGLDPRVNQSQGRQLQILAQLLLQKKRQTDLQDTALRNAEISAGTALLKDDDSQIRHQGLLKILGAQAEQSGITKESLEKNRLQQMVEGLMGDVFTQKGADPGFQGQALESLTGGRELGEVEPQLDPVSQAQVSDIEQDTQTSKALEEQRKIKTAILEQVFLAAKGGGKGKEKATTLLNTLIRVEQAILENYRRLVEAGAADPGNPPPEVVEASENLVLYSKLGKDILRDLGLNIPVKKEHINSIKALKKQFDSGDLPEEQFRAALLRLEKAGISRDTILKAMQ